MTCCTSPSPTQAPVFLPIDSFSQGTGLGLTIARMAAEHVGGSLTLDTNYTGGAKFDLIVPIVA